MASVIEWLWSLLPDKCVGENCPRTGVRGNENVVFGRVLCDYCSQRDHEKGWCVHYPDNFQNNRCWDHSVVYPTEEEARTESERLIKKYGCDFPVTRYADRLASKSELG